MPRHACHQTIPRHEIRSISRLKTNFGELSTAVAPLSSAGTTCHTALANVTLRYFRTSTPTDPSQHCHAQIALPRTRCLKSTSSYSRLFAMPRHACHQTIPRHEIRSISRLKTNFGELSTAVAPLSSAGTTCQTALANVTLRYFRTSTPTDPSQHCHVQIALVPAHAA